MALCGSAGSPDIFTVPCQTSVFEIGQIELGNLVAKVITARSDMVLLIDKAGIGEEAHRGKQ
jgi:hypothetical protein